MNIAIIAAAGAGTRMASDRPKQFLLLAGTPVIIHTLKVFEQCESINEVIVVLPAAESAGFLSLAAKYGLRKVSRVVPGGVTRADSVKRGLLAIRAATAEIVAVHDGVRPFVTVEEIDATVAAAHADGAAQLRQGRGRGRRRFGRYGEGCGVTRSQHGQERERCDRRERSGSHGRRRGERSEPHAPGAYARAP
jgi:CTP:molybdopterin cytidylyltransferase MocA